MASLTMAPGHGYHWNLAVCLLIATGQEVGSCFQVIGIFVLRSSHGT